MINANGYSDYDPNSPGLEGEEPRSQEDCPKGTTFISAVIRGEKGKISAYRVPAYCAKKFIAPQSQADCPAGTEFIRREGCPPGWPQELGCMPRVYTECRPIGKPDLLSEDTPTPTQSVSPKNYFLLYALAVGVGFYFLTRSKDN